MKYLKQESNAFRILIERKKLPHSSFSFRKKNGFLYIQFLERKPLFIFHRKDSTELDRNGQWKKNSSYYISRDKDKIYEWKDILKMFDDWLDKLI